MLQQQIAHLSLSKVCECEHVSIRPMHLKNNNNNQREFVEQ
jgi:hypothetical protein